MSDPNTPLPPIPPTGSSPVLPEDPLGAKPPNEDFQEEITSLDFTPAAKKTDRTKKTLSLLVLIIVLVSVPVAVFLTMQSQEIRKKAQESYPCQTEEDCPNPDHVCHYGYCTSCSVFDEPTCWTHTSCCWEAGVCKTGACPNPPPNPQVSCSADVSGVHIRNLSTTESVSGNVTWFSTKCNNEKGECFCGGATKTEYVSLGPGQSWDRGIAGDGCMWQSDLSSSICSASDAGCLPCETPPGAPPTPTPTPSPTPPSYILTCNFTRAYDLDWNQITNLNSLTIGQTVYFATGGTTTHPQGITKARFRINNGAWQETTLKHDSDYYIQFTVPSAGDYTVESMVYNPVLGWR